MVWRAIADAPRDGTPIVAMHVDGSGCFLVAWITWRGETGWWEITPDQGPEEAPCADAEDNSWSAGWVPFPIGLAGNAKRYLAEQYSELE